MYFYLITISTFKILYWCRLFEDLTDARVKYREISVRDGVCAEVFASGV